MSPRNCTNASSKPCFNRPITLLWPEQRSSPKMLIYDVDRSKLKKFILSKVKSSIA